MSPGYATGSMNIPLPFVAVFSEKVQFVTVGLASYMYIPPPLVFAVFPEKVQFVNVGLPIDMSIPPPNIAVFSEKVQFVNV